MASREFNFEKDRVRKLLKRMNYDSKKKTLVFLDTGAIIDAEAELARWKCYNSEAKIEKIYQFLLDKGLELFVTSPIMDEVSNHHSHNRVNGRHEISEANFEMVKKLHSGYESFLQSVRCNERERDNIRRDVYWTSILAFDNDEKKGVIDPISRADREFISAAILARYSHFPYKSGVTGEMVVQSPDEVILLSPDTHSTKLINTLLDSQLGLNYDRIRSIESR